jgi:hypothetical protein
MGAGIQWAGVNRNKRYYAQTIAENTYWLGG